MFPIPISKSFANPLPGVPQVIEQVCRDQGFLTYLYRSEVTGTTMQVNCEKNSLVKCTQLRLRDNACQHPGKDIPHASRRHSGITCSIDENLGVRCCYNGTKSFEDDVHVLTRGKLASNVDPIFIYECDVSINEA